MKTRNQSVRTQPDIGRTAQNLFSSAANAQDSPFKDFMAFFASLGGRVSVKRQEELVPVVRFHNALHCDTVEANHNAHSAPYVAAADWFLTAFLNHGADYAAQLFHSLWEEQRVIIQRGVSIVVDKAYPPPHHFLRYHVSLEIDQDPSLPAHVFPVRKVWAERMVGAPSCNPASARLKRGVK